MFVSMNEKASLPWEFYNEYERDPATGSYENIPWSLLWWMIVSESLTFPEASVFLKKSSLPQAIHLLKFKK